MSEGSSLSVEKPDNVLISPNGVFSAGFYSVGFNAYCFAIWYREPLYDGSHTTVWMANRDQPINGRLSKFTLLKNGNLILTDAGQLNVWATNTESISSVQLLLNDTGNLFLLTSEGLILWQSFQSPTDTLLPYQPLTRNTKLVSSRSQTNYSSGFYKLFFDEENVLSLAYDGPEASSMYWPDPWLKSWEAGRSSYNNSRIAVFNSSGHFKSTDDFQFTAADSGIGIQRRLTMDHDGNIRMYSLDEKNKIWNVTWQAKSQPCNIHGICGPNSLCTYVPHEKSGRRCSCTPGYKIKNETDQSLGCEPDFSLSCNESEIGFLHLPHVEFYGYDDNKICENYTYKRCANECLQSCNCYAFQYKFNLVVPLERGNPRSSATHRLPLERPNSRSSSGCTLPEVFLQTGPRSSAQLPARASLTTSRSSGQSPARASNTTQDILDGCIPRSSAQTPARADKPKSGN
ncbi:hypothetical protein HYC85_028749 [Camellia sinensis]|uniref:Bulb-type lectin domain-containing protein n=1 Tax=Camellia sinensis TaxID=4442 RepID=A0A7J7FYC1_CAMSI|nr:hypothetical protein HYC85_028749 [Camellia sinensis]